MQATPAPTPVPPATNPSKSSAGRPQQPVFTQSTTERVQAPVTIVTQTEAEMRAESLAGEARVKAEAETAQRKAGKAIRNRE